VSPEWPPLYHNAGVPIPDQESGRWHRRGDGWAQYFSLAPLGAWAECARYFSVRSERQARELRRNLWLVFVRETQIADLSSFDDYARAGLDPELAIGAHERSQELADELKQHGYRGVLSPSAALPGVTNLTLFGERYEKTLLTDPSGWENPNPNAWLPCQIVARGAPLPPELITETVFLGKPHEHYEVWRARQG
jgi:hypothetical protein